VKELFLVKSYVHNSRLGETNILHILGSLRVQSVTD